MNWKNKLSKQAEKKQNDRYGDHLEVYQLGGKRQRMEEKLQEVRSINGRYKIDRRMLRTVQKMERPKNLYT